MKKLAKDVSSDGRNLNVGFPEFKTRITEEIRKINNDPTFEITNKSDLKDLRWRYDNLARAFSRKELSFDGKGNPILSSANEKNIGLADMQTVDYNLRNNFEPSAMEIISLNLDKPRGVFSTIKNLLIADLNILSFKRGLTI